MNRCRCSDMARGLTCTNTEVPGAWVATGPHGADRGCRPDKSRDKRSRHGSLRGHAYIHAAVDDHTRLAYREIHDDETRETAAAFWRRAHAWFATHNITVHRVLTDNGGCNRSFLWRDTLAELDDNTSAPVPTDPKPTARSNGSTAPCSTSGPTNACSPARTPRRAALPGWLHRYNHHRPHTALAGQPPITRTNVSGQNI